MNFRAWAMRRADGTAAAVVWHSDGAATWRVKLHRERSKRGHAIASRHYSGPESDRQNGR